MLSANYHFLNILKCKKDTVITTQFVTFFYKFEIYNICTYDKWI